MSNQNANKKVLLRFMKNIFNEEGYFTQKKLFLKNYLRQDRAENNTAFINAAKEFMLDASKPIKDKESFFEILEYAFSIENKVLTNSVLSSNFWNTLRKQAKITANPKHESKIGEVFKVGGDATKKEEARKFGLTCIKWMEIWADKFPTKIGATGASDFVKVVNYTNNFKEAQESGEGAPDGAGDAKKAPKKGGAKKKKKGPGVEYSVINTDFPAQLEEKEYFTMILNACDLAKEQLKLTIKEDPPNNKKMKEIFKKMNIISSKFNNQQKMAKLIMLPGDANREFVSKVYKESEAIKKIQNEFKKGVKTEESLDRLRIKYQVQPIRMNDSMYELEEVPQPASKKRKNQKKPKPTKKDKTKKDGEKNKPKKSKEPSKDTKQPADSKKRDRSEELALKQKQEEAARRRQQLLNEEANRLRNHRMEQEQLRVLHKQQIQDEQEREEKRRLEEEFELDMVRREEIKAELLRLHHQEPLLTQKSSSKKPQNPQNFDIQKASNFSFDPKKWDTYTNSYDKDVIPSEFMPGDDEDCLTNQTSLGDVRIRPGLPPHKTNLSAQMSDPYAFEKLLAQEQIVKKRVRNEQKKKSSNPIVNFFSSFFTGGAAAKEEEDKQEIVYHRTFNHKQPNNHSIQEMDAELEESNVMMGDEDTEEYHLRKYMDRKLQRAVLRENRIKALVSRRKRKEFEEKIRLTMARNYARGSGKLRRVPRVPVEGRITKLRGDRDHLDQD